MSRRPCLAITLGDPCGIGADLLLASLPLLNRWADLLVVGARAGVGLLGDGAGAPVAWRWDGPGEPVPGLAAGVRQDRLRAWPSAGPGTDDAAGHAVWCDPTPEVTPDQLELGRGGLAQAGLAGGAHERHPALVGGLRVERVQGQGPLPVAGPGPQIGGQDGQGLARRALFRGPCALHLAESLAR